MFNGLIGFVVIILFEIIFIIIFSLDLKDWWDKCNMNYFMKIYYIIFVVDKI